MNVGAKDKPKTIEGSFLTLFNIENDPSTRVDRFMKLFGRSSALLLRGWVGHYP